MGGMAFFARKKNVMKKLFALPNIYVLLWALYYTQGTFIAQGSIWSRGVLLMFLFISLYYATLIYLKHQCNRYFKALGVLLLMFTIYGVYGMMSGVSFDYLKLIYLSLLPTFPFYYWSKKELITPGWIRIVFFAIAGVVIVQYFSSVRYIEANYTETDNSVVNIAYEILALLPLLFFWKRKPVIQYVMLAVILAVVLSTVKRGAIIVGALCAVYFLVSSSKESANSTKWYVWLLMVAFIIVGVRYVLNFYENSTYAQLRMENTMMGDSSGRDFIYSNAWKIFIDSNFFNLFFGHGAWATLRYMKVLAHNDWLELLVNQGLLGFFLYLNYWFAFYKTFKRNRVTYIKPVLGMLLIIFFTSTLFSMSYAAMTLPANLALGYSLAINDCGFMKEDN